MKLNRFLVLGLPVVALLSGCVINHSSKPSRANQASGNTAIQTSKQVERHYFNEWEKEIGYAQVVVDGDTLYVSGIPAGGKDMSEAMQKAYQRIADILLKFDATPDDIVKEVLFTKDMEAAKQAIEVRKSFFSKDQYPAATWIEVNRFFREEFLLEVDVVVSLRGK